MQQRKQPPRHTISANCYPATLSRIDDCAAALGLSRNKLFLKCLDIGIPLLTAQAALRTHAADPKAELPAVRLPEVK